MAFYRAGGNNSYMTSGDGGNFCMCNPGYACSTCGTFPCYGSDEASPDDVWGCNVTMCVNLVLVSNP